MRCRGTGRTKTGWRGLGCLLSWTSETSSKVPSFWRSWVPLKTSKQFPWNFFPEESVYYPSTRKNQCLNIVSEWCLPSKKNPKLSFISRLKSRLSLWSLCRKYTHWVIISDHCEVILNHLPYLSDWREEWRKSDAYKLQRETKQSFRDCCGIRYKVNVSLLPAHSSQHLNRSANHTMTNRTKPWLAPYMPTHLCFLSWTGTWYVAKSATSHTCEPQVARMKHTSSRLQVFWSSWYFLTTLQGYKILIAVGT